MTEVVSISALQQLIPNDPPSAPAALYLQIAEITFQIYTPVRELQLTLLERFGEFASIIAPAVTDTSTVCRLFIDVQIDPDFDPLTASKYPRLGESPTDRLTARHNLQIRAHHYENGDTTVCAAHFVGLLHPDGSSALQIRFLPTTLIPSLSPLVERHPALQSVSAFIVSILPYLLLPQQGVLLHSSGALDNQKAYLFSGPSTAGKTTTIRNSPHHTILSDELIALRLPKEGPPIAYGTPFFGDWRKNGANVKAPLQAIHFIKKMPHHRLFDLSASASFHRLCQVLCFRQPTALQTRQICEIIDRLCPYTRGLELAKNPEFWPIITASSVDSPNQARYSK